jgi:hypothetical protein
MGGLLPVATMLEKLGFQKLVEETLTVTRIPRVMTIYQFLFGMVLALYVGFSRLNHLRFVGCENGCGSDLIPFFALHRRQRFQISEGARRDVHRDPEVLELPPQSTFWRCTCSSCRATPKCNDATRFRIESAMPELPRLKTLEEFDFQQAPQIPAAKVRELSEGFSSSGLFCLR